MKLRTSDFNSSVDGAVFKPLPVPESTVNHNAATKRSKKLRGISVMPLIFRYISRPSMVKLKIYHVCDMFAVTLRSMDSNGSSAKVCFRRPASIIFTYSCVPLEVLLKPAGIGRNSVRGLGVGGKLLPWPLPVVPLE